MQCTGVLGVACSNEAEWVNEKGVCLCERHKLLLDAFTWENRNERTWRKVKEVTDEKHSM
ncbi:hypothetical protein LCGC14_1380370 [marine sediment metagenome]|uniref:Uncharacterized protein n=1 Tax=marine sediment metagenome TaxID=412755 RepID=A0A0F9N4K2_9ZZZZ